MQSEKKFIAFFKQKISVKHYVSIQNSFKDDKSDD